MSCDLQLQADSSFLTRAHFIPFLRSRKHVLLSDADRTGRERHRRPPYFHRRAGGSVVSSAGGGHAHRGPWPIRRHTATGGRRGPAAAHAPEPHHPERGGDFPHHRELVEQVEAAEGEFVFYSREAR